MRKQKIYRGGSTVYHDIGVKYPDEMALKAQLVMRLQHHIKRDGLTIMAAAKKLGIGQRDLSNALRGQFRSCSVMRLMRFLAIFGDEVGIEVKAKGEKKPLAISLSA